MSLDAFLGLTRPAPPQPPPHPVTEVKAAIEEVKESGTEWPLAKLTFLLRLLCTKADLQNKNGVHHMPEFKDKGMLSDMCKAVDAKPCNSCRKVLLKTEFSVDNNNKNKDKLQYKCKACRKDKSVGLANRKRKQEKNQAQAEESAKKPNSISLVNKEDKFVEWLVEELWKGGFETVVNFEFRRADIFVRPIGATGDLWLRIQVKTSEADGRKCFGHCHGYGYGETEELNVKHRMVMICGVLIGKDDGYNMWCFDGADVTGGETIHVSGKADDPSVPLRSSAPADKKPKSVKDIGRYLEKCGQWDSGASSSSDNKDDINVEPMTLVTQLEAEQDIKDITHKKEATLLYAYKQVVDRFTKMVRGNQQAYDATLSTNQKMQMKTYGVAGHTANLTHTVKGQQKHPYDAADDIDIFCEAFIVKSNGKYWFVYAQQETAMLVSQGYVTDVANAKYNYRTAIAPALSDELAKWILGWPYPCQKDFLKQPHNAFRAPIEVKPSPELPLEWLELVAHKATRPDLEPSEAVCAIK